MCGWCVGVCLTSAYVFMHIDICCSSIPISMSVSLCICFTIFMSMIIYLFISVCSEVVIFRPKRLLTKMEPSEVKYSDSFSVDKLKDWVHANM